MQETKNTRMHWMSMNCRVACSFLYLPPDGFGLFILLQVLWKQLSSCALAGHGYRGSFSLLDQ